MPDPTTITIAAEILALAVLVAWIWRELERVVRQHHDAEDDA